MKDIEELNREMVLIPAPYRETMALWLLARGRQFQPSFVLPEGAAKWLQQAFTGAAVDVASPLAEDAGVTHAAEVIERLTSNT